MAKIQIPKNNYTQIRLAGFGLGDDSLESQISQVDAQIKISVNKDKSSKAFKFFTFQNVDDYLCYVEAVNLLNHKNKFQDCALRTRSDQILQQNQIEKTISQIGWLDHEKVQNQLFFVVDNTEWPDAQYIQNWNGVTAPASDGSDSIQIIIEYTTTFTSNDKYYAWTFIFSILLIVFSSLAVLSFVCYSIQLCRYHRYAQERKQIKRELMQIKNTEYTNFLLQEIETIKQKNLSRNNSGYKMSLNESKQYQDQANDSD